ncbi:DUF6712 family protein [Flavobacterium sp.]|uniref:DUF6712 family protein n=1 Tax=Flavobacterium sp. TaxID=239 RepID=UPI004034B5A4
MQYLINIEDIKLVKDLGKKVDENKINPIIAQAHDDIREYLGINFYFDVVANKDSENYQDLLSGSSFSITGQYPQITYYQEGLKAMLIDLFMSRYIPQININFTPFGATVKTDQGSEPASDSALRDRAKEQSQMAGSKWELIKMYLTEKTSQFPAYNTCSNTIVTGERKMRLRRIA